MKKIFFVVLLAIGTFHVFAEDADLAPSWVNLSPLVLDGLDRNVEQLRIEAKALSGEQLFTAYQVHKKTPWEGFILNLMVGFGAGSFYQGNYIGGGILLAGDLVSISLIAAGIAAVAGEESSTGKKGDGVPMLIAGSVIFSISRVAGTLLPFFYAKYYNNKLLNILSGHVTLP
jgi:hypothetical protein